MSTELFKALSKRERTIEVANERDKDLGALELLPGEWASTGFGWNMIALPFISPTLPYRLLLNQFNEKLTFTLVDKRVPNRGVVLNPPPAPGAQTDQLLATLDYEQVIKQIASDDFPLSGFAGGPNLPIHHEAGLWLNMANNFEDELHLARLATIPHGDSVLALGKSSIVQGTPIIPSISGLPIGVDQSLTNPYLAPYLHFQSSPFQGLFNPVSPNDLLAAANAGAKIRRTTTLHVDSTAGTGGISNIPFIVKQANAAEMQSTFWIQELEDLDGNGNPKLRLQYSQIVMLDFFPRPDGSVLPIRWPHVSINTLDKVMPPAAAPAFAAAIHDSSSTRAALQRLIPADVKD